MSALAAVGLPLERAGLALSMFSFLALLPLLAYGARVLGPSASVTRLVLLLLLVNAAGTEYALTLLDGVDLHPALAAAVVFLMEAEAAPEAPGSGTRRVSAHVLVGLAYWVRYAGLFLLATVLVFYGLAFLWKRDRKSLVSAACCGNLGVG